jgi:sec-independent protein translocase protein TatB
MFDLGWTELLVIGVVALIVVGPKDLPMLFRKVGRFVGKAKGMAREFSRAMDQAADETGVNEVASTLKSATNPVKSSLDGVMDAAKSFKEWSPNLDAAGMTEDGAEVYEKIHLATANKAEARQAAKQTADFESSAGKALDGTKGQLKKKGVASPGAAPASTAEEKT